MSGMRKRIQLSPDVRDNKRIRYTEDGMAVTTLSLSPLGKEVTAAQLFDYFSTFGPVDNVHITALGYATFGSVKFTHTESAAQALLIKRHSIAGHSISATVAPNLHQAEPIKYHLPVEPSNVTGTCLVDLNEDCLWKILSSKYLGLMDLLSVAETCKRLKEVAKETFRREHKVLHFDKNSMIKIDEARRIFSNFGSVISELRIDSTGTVNERTNQIMNLAVTYCSNTLESLILSQCKFDESMGNRLIPLFNQLAKLFLEDVRIKGDCKDLFTNCKSLVELTIFEPYLGNMRRWCEKIGENTFPKLRNFKYDYEDYADYNLKDSDDYARYNWEAFILRHKTLRTISLDVVYDNSYLLPVIAENCGQLEELEIAAFGEEMSTVDYQNALKSLLVLDHLKVLKLHCFRRNVTNFIHELHLLKSLESLELMFAADVFELMPWLSQLKKLKVLRLTMCYGAKDLNLLGILNQLTELKLQFDGYQSDPNLDVVGMVERLINLETLEVDMSLFKMDRQKYLRIVHAVQDRPDRAKRTLAMKCPKDFILSYDDEHRQIVEFV